VDNIKMDLQVTWRLWGW